MKNIILLGLRKLKRRKNQTLPVAKSVKRSFFPFRNVLDAKLKRDDDLTYKELLHLRNTRCYKSGAPVLVRYFERKIKVYAGSKKGFRIIPESIATVSASLARVLLHTNQAEIITQWP